MHKLVELWALLLAVFLSKDFDQVGGSEWSADVGLINFEGRELGLEDCRLVPPPLPLCLLPRSLMLKLSQLKLCFFFFPLAVAGFV